MRPNVGSRRPGQSDAGVQQNVSLDLHQYGSNLVATAGTKAHFLLATSTAGVKKSVELQRI